MASSFTPPGSVVPNRIVFNQGTIDFGGSRIVQLDSGSFGVEWTSAPLLTVGSIKYQALNRHTQKTTLTGKVKSFPAEMAALAAGSSTTGSPVGVNMLDGQPTFQNPVLTFFDANGKEVQYQFINALFTKFMTNVKAEDYADFDFSMEAMDVNLVYTA